MSACICISKRINQAWCLALMLCISLTSVSCVPGRGGSEETTGETSVATTPQPSPQPVKPPPPPPDTEPIDVKINRVMQQALVTKRQYGDFRDNMFEDGLSQATTILCSTYRIQLLREEATDFFEKD